MKRLITFNLSARFELEVTEVSNTEALTRYQTKLIDIEEDDDKQNPLWTIQLISGETYSLAYQQIIANELVAFDSLTGCLNRIHSECHKLIAQKAKA